MRVLLSLMLVVAGITGAGAQSAKNFPDGIGYYVISEGRSWILYGTTQLGAAWRAGEIATFNKAIESALPIKRVARFVTYGIDFRTGHIPPSQLLSACLFVPSAPSEQVVSGPFPVRIKPIHIPGTIFSGPDLPIYEILLPDLMRGRPATDHPQIYWSLNLQDNCDRGWLFKIVEDPR